MSFGDPLLVTTPVLGEYNLYIGPDEPAEPTTNDVWGDTGEQVWKHWTGVLWETWGFGMPDVVDPAADELVVLGAETGEAVFNQKLLIKGAKGLEVTDSMPATQETGILYFVKP